MLARRFKDALVTNHRFELMTFDLFFVFKDGSTDPDALNRHSSLRFLPDTLAARDTICARWVYPRSQSILDGRRIS